MKKNILVTLSSLMLVSCSSADKKDNYQSQNRLNGPNRSISSDTKTNVPLQISGVPIYAGLGTHPDHPESASSQAQKACKYFGYDDVYDYSFGWSIADKGHVIAHKADGSTKIQPIIGEEGTSIFRRLVCSRKSSVPLQVNGLPIYAGLGGHPNHPHSASSQAQKACKYFGYDDVYTYSFEWSTERKAHAIVHQADGSTKIQQIREGGQHIQRLSIFKKLECSKVPL